MNDVIEHESSVGIQTYNGPALSSVAMVMDGETMDRMMRLAEIMAKGKSTVPGHLQGNTGDCMAVVMQSMQWKMNPFSVAQKTHFIKGTLGYEAQLVNAVITSLAPTTGRLQYEWFGPWENVVGNIKDVPSKNNPGETFRKLATTAADEKGCGVRVWATLRGESEPRVLELLLLQAGVRNSTLWTDDPKQQLAYLATKRWARLHVPDVLLGVYTPDELESPAQRGEIDVSPQAQEQPAAPSTRTQELKSRLKQTGPAVVVAGLSTVIRMISVANTREEIEAAREAVRQLPEQDQTEGVAAWKARVEFLSSQKQAVANADFDLSAFRAKISDCQNVDGLDVLIDEASSVAPAEAMDELTRIYTARRAELAA